ncbi:MAG: phosphate signaling complex protein PhoU [Lachnospiraceae bacterium]|nr:phosphate signaling complex protein PhoU [Lachnospiraceae bacterium]
MTTRVSFEHELENLKNSLDEMSLHVEHSIDKLFSAMEHMDQELAEYLYKNDRVVNDMERSIESQCLSIITRQQPVAGDLRLVSSALKVVTDIERIGDHSVDIAELILRWKDVELLNYSAHISPMIEASKDMVHRAVSAFTNKDMDAAKDVIKSDDVVDELFNKVKFDVIDLLKRGTDNPDICIDIMMIAKYLEKIGDHAVNIAEWEIFRETGSIRDIRLL